MNAITITLHGPLAIADGAAYELLTPLLEHKVNRFFAGGPLGHEHRMDVVSHYHLDDDGRLIFSAGLVPRVRQHLDRLGYAVEVDNRTHWGHLDGADHHMLDDPDLTAEDVRFLTALAKEPRGQVLVQRPTDMGRLIALFARLFSKFNIYVVARNKKRVQQLVNEISKHTDRFVTSDSRAVWSHNPRLFVGTMQLFHGSTSEGFHIAVFTDVESALSARSQEIATNWPNGTWYAFLGAPDGLSAYEQFRLDEVCGPVIYTPIEDNPLATVNVMFLDVNRNNGTTTNNSGLTRKREVYWHSPPWNQTIARTAEALGRKRRRQAVCILVESGEHGKELLNLLPRWELLTLNTDTNCIPAVGRQQIATFAYAERWGIGTDILIRADGGSGWPLTGGFPRMAQHQEDSVLVVDFNDTVDGAAARDTRSRYSMYEQLEWDVVAVDSGQVDVGVDGDDPRPADGNKALDQPSLITARERSIPAGQHVRT